MSVCIRTSAGNWKEPAIRILRLLWMSGGKSANQERPHESLGMRMPSEVYEASKKKWAGTPDQLDYEGLITRRIKSTGSIRFENQSIFLSTSLQLWDVGLKALRDETLEVFFARLLLGHLDPETASFIPILPDAKETMREAA